MPQKKKKLPAKTAVVTDSDERGDALKRMKSIGDGSIGLDILHMIKGRFRVLYIRTPEERRVIEFFKDLSVHYGGDVFQWDCDRGLLSAQSKEKQQNNNDELHGDPTAILAHIIDNATKQNSVIRERDNNGSNVRPTGAIYLLLDFHVFLDGIPHVERKLKEFSEIVSTTTIVIISPTFVCPATLEKEITLIDFPVPSYNEIKNSLKMIASKIPAEMPAAAKEARQNEEELIKAASGLTITEAENAYAFSLVRHMRFDIDTILEEKKQMIRKGGILEYRDSKFTLDDIGGLDTLKEWLLMRRLAFKNDAQEFGLPFPKGLLLTGIPGTGKSMACDALAAAYKMPLLRLDFGAVFSSHVGESEDNMRKCLQTAEAISPTILWIDEIEKGIGGVESSNATDGGVTNRVFGTMLTWMQDKTKPVFVVCTANRVNGIPPEFMRAGRFDEIFFLDLPNDEQRRDVIDRLILRKKRNPKDFDAYEISEHSDKYSPVEIEKAIDLALFSAFSDGKRKVTTDDVVNGLKSFCPLYNSRRDEMESMREWALGEDGLGGRAVLANSRSKSKSKKIAMISEGRALELDV